MFSGGVAAWLVYQRSRKGFEDALAELGFPRTKEDLWQWWQRSRHATNEEVAQMLDTQYVLHQLERHVDAATSVEKAWELLFDPTCDPQVAAWLFTGAFRKWVSVFIPTKLQASLDERTLQGDADFVEQIRVARVGPLPQQRYRVRIVPAEEAR